MNIYTEIIIMQYTVLSDIVNIFTTGTNYIVANMYLDVDLVVHIMTVT